MLIPSIIKELSSVGFNDTYVGEIIGKNYFGCLRANGWRPVQAAESTILYVNLQALRRTFEIPLCGQNHAQHIIDLRATIETYIVRHEVIPSRQFGVDDSAANAKQCRV